MSESEKVLFVVAHPDDEVLGAGGAIAYHVSKGHQVQVLFAADGESARKTADSKSKNIRRENAERAAGVLQTLPPVFLDLPDNRLDGLPILDVIQPIEDLLRTYPATTIYTHHWGDLNVDHRLVCEATLTAARPQPSCSVRRIFFFEVPSSSEWNSPSVENAFIPTRFIDVTQYLSIKMAALKCYAGEMRPYPHARSWENIAALARWRGATVGLENAEAFVVGRDVVVHP